MTHSYRTSCNYMHMSIMFRNGLAPYYNGKSLYVHMRTESGVHGPGLQSAQ